MTTTIFPVAIIVIFPYRTSNSDSKQISNFLLKQNFWDVLITPTTINTFPLTFVKCVLNIIYNITDLVVYSNHERWKEKRIL